MSDHRAFLGEPIAEAVAIFIVISFGCSVAAMIVLYDPNPYENAYWARSWSAPSGARRSSTRSTGT